MHRFDEALDRGRGVRPLHAGPDHHHRTLRAGEDRERRIDIILRRQLQRWLGPDPRHAHVLELNLAGQHVHRNLKKGRSWITGYGVADRHLDVVGDAVGVVAGIRPFTDRAHDRDVVHLLQRTTPQIVERPLSANYEDRAVGAPGVRDPGDAIGHAWTGGQYSAADLARVETAPGVRGVHRGLLMAHIDNLDPLVEATVVDRHDVSAA